MCAGAPRLLQYISKKWHSTKFATPRCSRVWKHFPRITSICMERFSTGLPCNTAAKSPYTWSNTWLHPFALATVKEWKDMLDRSMAQVSCMYTTLQDSINEKSTNRASVITVSWSWPRMPCTPKNTWDKLHQYSGHFLHSRKMHSLQPNYECEKKVYVPYATR